MALGEVLTDAAVHAVRVGVGMSKEIGIMSQLKKRFEEGKLFDPFTAQGVPFSTMGKVMVAGWGIQNAVKGAVGTYQESELGMPSGEMASATPEMSYTRFGMDAGATGDLVFAMNRNRRG